ncbi:TetR/AcrR family transcriptional regulator [Romeriopsis navalis]|uniref:TetR/AcrR family transcriptional regulator n=1 Tax=Romeriopsis navalis TaxID=2992132 RepID=UPI0021F86AD3|nr:TetR/AcrR family transcriptional regulator [Romeriopsis navalis]
MSRSNPPESKSDAKAKPDKAQAILDGALQVFTTQGFAAASMDRIAKAAGVSKPTLYSYFQDKEGLFVALIQQLVETHSPITITNAPKPDFQTPPAAFLRQIAGSVLGHTSSNQPFLSLMRLLIGESEKFPELSQTFVQELSKPVIERLAFYFEMHPDLNFPDPIVTARVFVGSVIHYIIVQYIMQGDSVMPLERERMINGLVDLILAAGMAPTNHKSA